MCSMAQRAAILWNTLPSCTTAAINIPSATILPSPQAADAPSLPLGYIKNYEQVCVMGARAARNFFDYKNPVGETITVNGVPFKVVGVYEREGSRQQLVLG